MIYIDSWGNEYPTEKATREGLLQILRNKDDYYQIISEELNIPWDVFKWITTENNRKFSFGLEFKDQILKAEQEWVESYWWDVEEVEE